MSVCEKCWEDSRSAVDPIAEYHRLVASRECTPEEQAGPFAPECSLCGRRTVHQHTQEHMCGCVVLGNRAAHG